MIMALVVSLSMFLVPTAWASGKNIRAAEIQIARYKQWLDSVGPRGTRYWIKLDAKYRPYRLYVGEEFFRASYREKKRFVELYSHYLAGHPDKFVLIDIFGLGLKKPVAEFGWGGFKLIAGPPK